MLADVEMPAGELRTVEPGERRDVLRGGARVGRSLLLTHRSRAARPQRRRPRRVGAFYSKLFATEPAKVRARLRQLRHRRAAAEAGAHRGHARAGGTLNHLGVEVESTDEVAAAKARLAAEGLATATERTRWRVATPCRTRCGSTHPTAAVGGLHRARRHRRRRRGVQRRGVRTSGGAHQLGAAHPCAPAGRDGAVPGA